MKKLESKILLLSEDNFTEREIKQKVNFARLDKKQKEYFQGFITDILR